MGRTEDKKVPRNNPNEGTAARTRPFSFEDIMSRRKAKMAMGAKNAGNESKEVSAKGIKDDLEFDGAYKTIKDSEAIELESFEKVELKKFKEGGDRPEVKHKRSSDLESNKTEKPSKIKNSTDRESKRERQSNHKIATTDWTGNQLVKDSEKNIPEYSSRKSKHNERDRIYKREGKRKYLSNVDASVGGNGDISIFKRRDSAKLRDSKHLDRTGRKREYLQTYHEELSSKRRRSRSWEHAHQGENRSFSISPSGRRHTHSEHDHRESSPFKDKVRKRYNDSGKYRTSANNRRSSGHNWKRGSGLGGYSPRKRRTEVAAKTPPPIVHSPEKKSTTWDQRPAGSSDAGLGSLLASLQSSTSKVHELTSLTSLTSSIIKAKPFPSSDIPSGVVNASIDSIQLTQATRTIRRVYIENLPPSATEKAVVDSLNEFLLSSGVNRIRGTKPCISCIVNKEKCQALVEFLTPEDATTALSFDGRSLFGTVLKIRRPKDFVEATVYAKYKLDSLFNFFCDVDCTSRFLPVAKSFFLFFHQTGASEKPEAVIKAITEVVRDSPQKIFVAGVSKILSADMLREIVGAFGVLKAYHFEFKDEIDGPCAFLEYADPSITMKACAGLNGMKLGGSVLTAVLATPHASADEDTDSAPSYGIPEHAKPLLSSPTKVLQLKNFFAREEFLLLTGPEVEETLEDIRLECARFGTVKSVNVVKYECSYKIAHEALRDKPNDDSTQNELAKGRHNSDMEQNDNLPPSNETTELEENSKEATENTNSDVKKPIKDLAETDSIGSSLIDGCIVQNKLLERENPKTASDNVADDIVEANNRKHGLVSDEPNQEEDTLVPDDTCARDKADSRVEDREEISARQDASRSIAIDKDDSNSHRTQDLGRFEPGCVLVEYLREEAACMAAHCLHGRSYGERVIASGYVPHDLYLSSFPR